MIRQFRDSTSSLERVLKSAPKLSTNRELQRLQAENARYRALTDNAPIGYLTVNPHSLIVDINQAGADLLGKNARQIRNTRLSQYLPAEDQKTLEQQIQTMSGHSSVSMRTVIGQYRRSIPVMLYLTSVVTDKRSEPLCQITMLDLSEYKATEDNLRIARDGLHHVANHDSLTRLPNRFGFQNHISTKISASKSDNNKFALLLLNLDRFKSVNDTLGHQNADHLLKDIADRLKKTVGPLDTVARIGGDEFAVVMETIDTDESIDQLIRQVRSAFSEPYLTDDQEIHVTACVGVSIFPDHAKDSTELMRCATTAMCKAKSTGRNGIRYFSRRFNTRPGERFKLEKDLRNGFRNKQFELYFQPQYDIANRTIVSYEALLRWNHPTQGLLAPAAFIDAVEESGLIEPMGDWIITEACTRLAQLRANGNPARRVSVNVSAKQFAGGKLCKRIENILKQTGTEANGLEIELTESALFDDLTNGIGTLEHLRRAGVDIAIDDFGTGYSSFSRLQQIPASRVKIDKSFVHGIPENKKHMSILQGIISLAHNLGMEVVSEGVETHKQALSLSKAGCDYLQGYYVGKPVPFSRVASAARLRTVEAV